MPSAMRWISIHSTNNRQMWNVRIRPKAHWLSGQIKTIIDQVFPKTAALGDR